MQILITGILLVIAIITAIFCIIGLTYNRKDNHSIISDTLEKQQINATKTIKNELTQCTVIVDEHNKKIAICNANPRETIEIIDFSKIIECQLLEDSNIIQKGGIGRAVVGSVIAGGVGAIVGATTRKSKNVINDLQIRILTNDINNSFYIIHIIDSETKKDSLIFRHSMEFANNVYSTIMAIIKLNDNSNNVDIATNEDFEKQIEKLSNLKEKGIITQEEFNESKNKILSKL